MGRASRRTPWQVSVGFGALLILAATIAGWDDVWLDLRGEPGEGRFLYATKDAKGRMSGVYAYRADGEERHVVGGASSDPTSTVDVVPGHPSVARLHVDAGKGRGAAELLGFFGLASLALGLGERLTQGKRTA